MNKEIMVERIDLSEAVTVLRLWLFAIENGVRSVAEIAEFDVNSTDIDRGMIYFLESKQDMGSSEIDFHFTHKSDVDFGKAKKWQTKLKKVVNHLLIESVYE